VLDEEKVPCLEVIYQQLIDWASSKKQGARNDVSGGDISVVDELGG
jgi:hypothetical protein